MLTPSTDTTRDRLLAAALTLLDEGGPEAVTLREVGARVGVSRTAPYRHFTDKRHLLAALGAAELDALTDDLRAALGRHPRSERARMRALLQTYVARALAHPRRHALAMGAWAPDGPESAVHEAADRLLLVVVGEVVRAQAAGVVRAGDPARITALANATLRGAVDLHLAGHLSRDGKGGADPADLADDLLVLLAPG